MSNTPWWRDAVFYQIYPRSFTDGNGDGIGDFMGMAAKLDYLAKLGVDALWISPHFPSPNLDWGYDVSDYLDTAPEYGGMPAFRAFLDGAHGRGLKVILDLVLNHTSDLHPWFLESASSRDNPKADWYVWADRPPNDWQSCFDGPAWTYVPERGQYYYHYFMRQQPDLNWHNPDVKKAMWDAVRFWLDLGVDGFRLDAIGTIFEDPDLAPHGLPLDLARLRRLSETAVSRADKRRVQRYWHDMFKRQWGQPGVHELMKELRALVDGYQGDRVLIAEDDNIAYQGRGDDEIHMVFNFPLMRTESITPAHVRSNQRARQKALDRLPARGWPCNTLGNHDSPRMRTRFGGVDPEHSLALARLNAAMVTLIRGTPVLYNGEELGMEDLVLDNPADLRDTMAVWYLGQLTDTLGVPPDEAARRAADMTRDRCRSPVQWGPGPNADFCPAGVRPWLPVHPDHARGVNAADQETDPDSILAWYRRILALRRAEPALRRGEQRFVDGGSGSVLAWLRREPGSPRAVLVALNYGDTPAILRARSVSGPGTVLESTDRQATGSAVDARRLRLAPLSAVVVALENRKS
ncbi:MAG: DUF3459 domain-containing protein [Spirochaetales bacterium]|nr:DUF3459 domain-containing protein [Spirochaetales bacterium]